MATRRRAASKTMTGAVSDLQRRVRYLQAATPPSRLATQVVARTNVRPRAINSDQIELAAVTNDQIAADAIRLANMGTNSVGEGQIVDGSVSNSKVAEDAIATGNLQNSSVTEDKLGNSSVTSGKLANSSVNESKITSSAVTAEKIRDGAVGRSKIEDQAVDRSKIQDRAVGSSQIADSAVGTSQIGNSQVTNTKIASGISGSKIGSGIDGKNISNGTIFSSKLSSGTPAAIISLGLTSGTGIVKQGATISVATALVVDRGLRAGFGINKRSNLINVATGDLRTAFASSSHVHRYDRPGAAFVRFGTHFTAGPSAASSIKVKKNVSAHRTVDPKKLLNLELKKFQYKRSHADYHLDSNRQWMHGYIIEDLLSLGFKEAIHYNKEGEPEKLDYGLMSVLVLELVKVQQQEIDCLQEKVKKLEKK